MSFLRHKRSIVRWEMAPDRERSRLMLCPRPPHRLDESQPVIPRQVALQQSLPPLHQPGFMFAPTGWNCKPSPPRGGGIFDRRNAEFSTGVDTTTNKTIGRLTRRDLTSPALLESFQRLLPWTSAMMHR